MSQISAIGANVAFKAAQGANNPIGATTPQTSVQPQTTQQAPESEEKLILGKFTKKQALIGAAAAAGITAAVVGGILLHKKVKPEDVFQEAQKLADEATKLNDEFTKTEEHAGKLYDEAQKVMSKPAGEITDENGKVIGKLENIDKYTNRWTEYVPDTKEAKTIVEIERFDNGTITTIDEFIKGTQNRYVFDDEYLAYTFKGIQVDDDTVKIQKFFMADADGINYGMNLEAAANGKGNINKLFRINEADNGEDTLFATVNSNFEDCFSDNKYISLDGKTNFEKKYTYKYKNGNPELCAYRTGSNPEKMKLYEVKDGKLKEITEQLDNFED